MPVPANHSKPVRTTAKESAYKQILHWIIDGTLYPGEKLNDTELAEALGVSRTPIRESLQLLESQGLVKMYPGKATQVTEVEKESIKDLLPPLAVLQALSTELAIDHISDKTISSLKNINQEFANALYQKDYHAALNIDEHFHQLIVDTANNTYISGIVENLQAHVRRLFFHNSIILSESSIEVHDTIIHHIENGDKEKASALMKQNWLDISKDFNLSNTINQQ
ncbi:GntR family transcriptional regulator [Ornithinibacillus sp. BX22]|uniref:GntR family transcriptional regulator n=2 Tax=Ornithinibacillus TaxID=484508 RepID=A0A923L5H1_9BACI|nr:MULTISPECIES: GntR family transcriptional regulator [Ornithinibacillus]MBC5636796.1 GntR family transcriptional regulator [Ornithinibacillus hominis]MBS3681362.1 GntR family transcriptional regulator [Ornithinibacillus massiliensis]